ncbi:MAG: elongation factor Tu [Lachnospiraceae bacterium]|nr:elongation factor Tu [Lachnospiraceae bacterium]
MEQLYLCKNEEELQELKKHTPLLMEGMEEYVNMLQSDMGVKEIPKCIVWTDYRSATELITELPVPAFTNDWRTVMTPYLDAWKGVYLSQLKDYDMWDEKVGKVRDYYENLPISQVRQIFGHEFVHWSEYFWDELFEETMWFEEGMAEYISRKWYLTQAEYEKEKEINRLLIELFEEQNGEQSLNGFDQSVYEKGMTTVFYYYWKSFLTVEELVRREGGNIEEVMLCYQRWGRTKREVTLLDWFDMH